MARSFGVGAVLHSRSLFRLVVRDKSVLIPVLYMLVSARLSHAPIHNPAEKQHLFQQVRTESIRGLE
jgi:hypothetical protein